MHAQRVGTQVGKGRNCYSCFGREHGSSCYVRITVMCSQPTSLNSLVLPCALPGIAPFTATDVSALLRLTPATQPAAVPIR